MSAELMSEIRNMQTRKYGPAELSQAETFWRDHQKWLEKNGYMLRPRYMPDWKPSWLTTDGNGEVTMKGTWLDYEDARTLTLARTICDATRISDGQYVTLKTIKPSVHPYEADIAAFFSGGSLSKDPKNHCVPLYEVLQVPDDRDQILLVMPLLRPYDKPPFETIGEAVDYFTQIFEGVQFMHQHHVAHRDCMNLNIMMDGTMYPNGWHPTNDEISRDWTSGYAKHFTRTQRPPKYFLIDFGIARRYDPKAGKPLEDPIWGGDKTVPEFQKSNAACDPFPTDVYYLGNMLRQDFLTKPGFSFMQGLVTDMVRDDPTKRPTMDEVVTRFATIRKSLGSYKLRSRVPRSNENGVESAINGMVNFGRRIKWSLQRIPAIPSA